MISLNILIDWFRNSNLLAFSFPLLNREKKYDIEDNNLESKYKEWQKKLHPDLVHSKSEVCPMDLLSLSGDERNMFLKEHNLCKMVFLFVFRKKETLLLNNLQG